MNNQELFCNVMEKYSNGIPIDVIDIARKLSIQIYSKSFKSDKISGFISKDESGVFICVNENHPATRQIFTIAHEIGHFVLHEDCLNSGDLAPTVYKLGDGIVMPRADILPDNADYRRKEAEANKFAAELLMPKEEFLKYANSCDNLVELANKFQVSVGAASIRANGLGIEFY